MAIKIYNNKKFADDEASYLFSIQKLNDPNIITIINYFPNVIFSKFLNKECNENNI
jgi:hypothetical protein